MLIQFELCCWGSDQGPSCWSLLTLFWCYSIVSSHINTSKSAAAALSHLTDCDQWMKVTKHILCYSYFPVYSTTL